MKSVLQGLVYGGVRLAEALARSLPPQGVEAFAALAGATWHRCDGRRRRRARANLEAAFPGMEEPVLRRRVRASFDHLARVPFEALLAPRHLSSPRAIARRVRIEGDLTPYFDGIAEGRPVLLWTAHLGNWEVAGHILRTLGAPLTAVMRPIDNPYVDAYVRRERGGPESLIPHRGGLRPMRRALAEGRWLAVVGDQNAGRNGTFVPFFGIPASTHAAAAWLATRQEVPLLVGVCLRDTNRTGSYVIRFAELPRPAPAATREEITRVLQAYNTTLEAWIRDQPEQYNWLHRRWKSRPPDGPVHARHPTYDHHQPVP